MAKITISTTISQEDYAFCKKYKLKWSRLLENAISISKKLFEEGNDPELLKSYNNKIKRLEDTNSTLIRFLTAKGLNDELIDFE